MAKNLGSLNIGDLIEVPVKPDYHSFLGERIVFKVADKNHPGYRENSVTLITDKCIAVMAFDAIEPTSTNEVHRGYGNNRYAHSNIHQWLNSTAGSGGWYTPQHEFDRPPEVGYVTWNPYAHRAGFLAMFKMAFGNRLMETTLRMGIWGVSGTDTIVSKVFLMSPREAGISTGDGSRLAIFSDSKSRMAYLTPEGVANSEYQQVNAISPCAWLTRGHITGDAGIISGNGVWGVNSRGEDVHRSASASDSAIRPLCNLKANFIVSDAPNSRGNYEIQLSDPPSISGEDCDLGTKYEGFSYDYTVTDPESEAVTVTEKVGETLLRTYTPELGKPQTLSLSGETFTSLPNGDHTITITATDSADNVFTRTLTFKKSISGFEIVLKNPRVGSVQPRRAYVDVFREIPAGGSFKVEVTNNPFDPEPVWEDCTMAVLRHLCHIFSNTVNESEQFGMNVRVTVKRGRALTPCWVSGIETNFE